MAVSLDALRVVVAPAVAAAGADLEDLSVERAGSRHVVRVIVDTDRGVTLDDVADVSKAVSAALDELDGTAAAVLPGAYVLEVTSPGVDRPLTAVRHWRRNVGRLVSVTPHEGASLTGRVVGADDSQVVLEVDGTRHVFAYAELLRGEVQVEFSHGAGLDGSS